MKNTSLTPHAADADAVASALEADLEKGLSASAVTSRRAKFGLNTIDAEKRRSPVAIFLAQLKSPIVFLLVFAAGMSGYFQEWVDVGAILVVILVNAAIGFWMEFRAERSMEALKKLVTVHAKVMRDHKLREINSEEIVPGDIVLLEAGNIVPVDGRVFLSTQLQADESALTGESTPVEKLMDALPEKTTLPDRTNMVYKGTHISKGNGSIIATAIGMETELGKIARMVQTADQAATPLEKKLRAFSKVLIFITLGLVVGIFIAGLLYGQNLPDMLRTSIALAVAAIPEGLPIVATVALAQGMLKMAKQKVIVKKLSSVETLGCTNVICTDKTGTLTQNKIAVTDIRSGFLDAEEEQDNEEHPGMDLVYKVAILCSTAELQKKGKKIKEIGDPLETGLLKYASENGQNISQLRKDFPKIDEVPFSSETKLMATLHENDKELWVFAKGAAEELIPQCKRILGAENEKNFTPTARKHWLEEAERMAAEGRRVIAAAYKQMDSKKGDITKDLVFLCLIGMIDPPRKDAFKAIEECKSAGIQVVMITGDHPATAKNIAVQLGIAEEEAEAEVMLGKDMADYSKLKAKDKKDWRSRRVFARVSPSQKLDLIQVYQEGGNVVGMTGDGVNDAPALKKADIGIAMGRQGTQVAQDAADMVLKDDSFSSIVKAIHQGRVIAENIRKFVIFLLSTNLSELMSVAVAAVFNLPFQLFPLQILFINLVTDVLPALALGVTKGSPDIMAQPPQRLDEPIIDARRWKAVFFYAAVLCVTSVGAVFFSQYTVHRGEDWNPELSNNILFFALITAQLFHVLNMGRNGTHLFNSEVFKNKYVWLALLCSFSILVLVYLVPPIGRVLSIHSMAAVDWLIAGASAVVAVGVIQGAKLLGVVRQ